MLTRIVAFVSGIHPVREALRSGRSIDRVLIAKGSGGPRVQEIVELCRERHIPVRFENRESLDKAVGSLSHQGVVAFGASTHYVDFAEVLQSDLLLALDGIEDPHNLGAIVRTANAAGVGGVLVPDRRSAGLTDTVAKVAAGALAHVPITRIGNVSRTLEELKRRGYWIYGLDENGSEDYDLVTYNTPTVFVLGAEGKGIHQLVKKHCDVLVRIPMSGRIASLNVSVAAGVVLFEYRRRMRSARPEPRT